MLKQLAELLRTTNVLAKETAAMEDEILNRLGTTAMDDDDDDDDDDD